MDHIAVNLLVSMSLLTFLLHATMLIIERWMTKKDLYARIKRNTIEGPKDWNVFNISLKTPVLPLMTA
jgi:hypothetical protein